MTRHNLCPNPALGVDVTGWAGAAAPTRTAVTGFIRDWAARYQPPPSFMETPRCAVTAGLAYTLSFYARVTTAFSDSTINSYIGWYNAGGSAISFDSLALANLPNGVVVRRQRTGTAPVGAVAVNLVLDTIGGNFVDLTALLVEQDPSAQAYADGDTAGWAWDGTVGLSPSSELEVSVGLAGRVVGRPSPSGLVAGAASRSLVGAVT